MEGFSMIRADAWKCNKCDKVYLNADEAEDCCSEDTIELGEPDELPVYNHAMDTIDRLRARNAELERAYDAILDDCRIQEQRIAEIEAEVKLLDNRRTELCKTIAIKSNKIANLEAEVERLRRELEMLNQAEYIATKGGLA